MKSSNFREATEGIFHELYVGSAVKSPYGCASTVTDIKAGKLAEVCDLTTIKKLISDDFGAEAKCNFYKGSEPLLSTSFAMAFRVHTVGCGNNPAHNSSHCPFALDSESVFARGECLDSISSGTDCKKVK